jgi:cell division protein FtsZ
LPNIKVVGVGGCASQAVNQLWDTAAHNDALDLMIMNTDVQELAYNLMPDSSKLLLGTKAANWTSTRGNPDVGKAAALECADAISSAVAGADLVVVVAGMGGGTGRGAGPVVADIARRQGAFTVAIAATPTSLTARQSSTRHVEELYHAADALVMLPTHKLLAGSSRPLNSTEVYAVSDRLMIAGIQGMADWITGSVLSNLGDLRTSMSGGSSWIGHGTAMGPERAACAATAAINSPLRLGNPEQASSLLVLITAPQDSTTAELNEVAEVIHSHCDPSIGMTCRLKTTPAPSGALSVTVFATHPGPGSSPALLPAMPAGFARE